MRDAQPQTVRHDAPLSQSGRLDLESRITPLTPAIDSRTRGTLARAVLPAGEMVLEERHAFHCEYFLG